MNEMSFIPEHPLYGSLEEHEDCWFRQARGQIPEEDKPRVSQGEDVAYFGAVNSYNSCRWGLRLDKTISYYEGQYGKAESILTTPSGSPKYIQFENHKYCLGDKPTYRLRDFRVGDSLPYQVDPELVCSQTFKDGRPCTRPAWGQSGMCKTHVNQQEMKQ